MPLAGMMRRGSSPRRAATDRASSSSSSKENHDDSNAAAATTTALQIEVQQWREHGRQLSEVVRRLQGELEDERSSVRMLLEAQEEKLRLLESMLSAQQQGVLEASHDDDDGPGPGRRPAAAAAAPPAWLPKWLSLPVGGGNDGGGGGRSGGGSAGSDAHKSPPAWSKWLSSAAAAASAASASSSSSSLARPPSPPRTPSSPPRQYPRAELAPQPPSPSTPLPLARAPPSHPPGSSSSSLQPPLELEAVAAMNPTPHDWADAHTAARRLNRQWVESGGGRPTVSARSVEQFLDSMLSAVAPASPPKRAPLNPLLDDVSHAGAEPARAHHAHGGSGGGSYGALTGAERTTPTTATAAVAVSSPAAQQSGCPARGGSIAQSPATGDASTAPSSSTSAVPTQQQRPVVVALGAALEDHVSLHEPSPPVTTRSRQSSGARSHLSGSHLQGKGRRRKGFAGSSEATTVTSEATSQEDNY